MVLPFQETKARNYLSHTLLSALRKRIISLIHDKRKTRAFQLSSRRTRLRYRESIFASINKIRDRWEDNWITKSSSSTLRESNLSLKTIVRTESESNKREAKNRTAQSLPGRYHIGEARVSRTSGKNRGIPSESNLHSTYLPTYVMFVYAVGASLFRRAFRAGWGYRMSRTPTNTADACVRT